MLRLGWRYRGACLWVIALQAGLVLFQLGTLGLTGLGIDVVRHALQPESPPPTWPWRITPPADWSALVVVWWIAGLILAVAAAQALLKYVAARAACDLSQRVLLQLRSDVYDKLQRLSFRFFDATESSSIINRAAGDAQAVRTFVDGVIIKVIGVGLSLVIYMSYMLSVHVPLTLACLATSPLLVWGAIQFSRMVQPEYRRGSELVDRLVLTLVENFQGIQVVKAFAREGEESEKFASANQAVLNQKRRLFWRVSLFQPLMGLLPQLNMLVLIGYGGYLVIHDQMPLGAGLFVFAGLLQEFSNQISQIINIVNTIQTSLTGAQRVFEVLDAPLEIRNPAQPIRLERVRGELEFVDVQFGYRPGEPVLQDISLKIAPGECIALAGATGAGKSTLLSLVSRFYDVESGAVRIDGQDVRELDLDQLRRHIGLVFQESFLFSNTIAANITFGQPAADAAELRRVARLACADEFIARLPDGFQTLVGEHGANLSGGQRQRLAIARALLLDPPILILDDATSALDPETEHEIQQAIQNATVGRTTLIVSNRVSTLRRADRILMLERGRIVQVGTHAELSQRRGPYRRWCELQLGTAPAERRLVQEPRR